MRNCGPGWSIEPEVQRAADARREGERMSNSLLRCWKIVCVVDANEDKWTWECALERGHEGRHWATNGVRSYEWDSDEREIPHTRFTRGTHRIDSVCDSGAGKSTPAPGGEGGT